MRHVIAGLVLMCAVVLLPAAASAQGIAGAARDNTGALLPGVSVEASSPVMIEKSRTVVTDASGQYRIEGLLPGTYTVTFTLQGFKTTIRADIVLEGTLVAQVNGQMALGTISESITVTGASPVVDVVSNRTAFVETREVLDALPVSSRSLAARVNLVPGMSVNFFVLGQYSISVHGSAASDMTIAVDGMRLNNLCGNGQFSGMYLNDGAAQEIAFSTGANSAEISSGGMRMNVVPKDGGNKFSGAFFGYGSAGNLQAENRSADVKKIITTVPGIDYDLLINPSFGGPIVKDKAWFYLTYRRGNYVRYAAGAVFADGKPIPSSDMGNYSLVPRLTWQATSKNKFRMWVDRQSNGEFFNNADALRTAEASWDAEGGGWTPQIKWTQTTTNKILLEAGYIRYDQPYQISYAGQRHPGGATNFKDHPVLTKPTDLPHNELTTGKWSGANEFPWTAWTLNNGLNTAMSYVTGSHSVKTGMTLGWGSNEALYTPNGNIYSLYTFAGGPAAVVVRNTPFEQTANMNSDLGLFAQDAWTLKRLTLNYGARYDHFNSSVPAQFQAGTAESFVKFDRDFPALPNVPNWNDWAVRIGGAYDLFGDGKTALKVGANRYMESMALGFANGLNPMTSTFETRGWVDFDKNNSILDSAGKIQFNEVFGGTANFGALSAATKADTNLRRGYNWEQSVSVQRELMPRVSATVGYYRRNYSNLRLTDNLNLGLSDWNSYGITGPTDSRFPDGQSAQPITMYNVNGNKIGSALDNRLTYSTTNSAVYSGFEIEGNARFSKGFAFGGFTTQRTNRDNCDQRDNPNNIRFCGVDEPFRPLLKGSVSYEFPYAIQVAASYYGNPGSSVAANYTYNTAAVLAAGAPAGTTVVSSTSGGTTQSVNLIVPNTMFLDYVHRLDVRVARNFRVGRYRVQGFMDVFNVMNAGTVTNVNQNWSAVAATNTWLQPTSLLTGATLRFGTQMSF